MSTLNLLPKDEVFLAKISALSLAARHSAQLLCAALNKLSQQHTGAETSEATPGTNAEAYGDTLIRVPDALPATQTIRDIATLNEQIQAARLQARQTFDAMSESLCNTFITPFDREDLQELASVLYRVPKLSEKLLHRLYISQLPPMHQEWQTFSRLILEISAEAETVAGALIAGSGKRYKGIPEAVKRIDELEAQADALLGSLLTELFSVDLAPEFADCRQFVMRKDVYGMLEKVTDVYRDFGHIALRLMLKHA
ncbi:MAG: DUF47 family protein [Vampirovibrionales bacterium]|nr:DUF47 family protein [Vampirovibrionales bacterium]